MWSAHGVTRSHTSIVSQRRPCTDGVQWQQHASTAGTGERRHDDAPLNAGSRFTARNCCIIGVADLRPAAPEVTVLIGKPTSRHGGRKPTSSHRMKTCKNARKAAACRRARWSSGCCEHRAGCVVLPDCLFREGCGGMSCAPCAGAGLSALLLRCSCVCPRKPATLPLSEVRSIGLNPREMAARCVYSSQRGV